MCFSHIVSLSLSSSFKLPRSCPRSVFFCQSLCWFVSSIGVSVQMKKKEEEKLDENEPQQCMNIAF
jgi:hypothetical protein